MAGDRAAAAQAALVKIAKKLKKNNVAVDVVAFGSEGEDANTEKLEAFREAVNSGDSHMVSVPAGTVLSDMLFSSPIFQVEGGAGYGAPAGEGAGAGPGEGYDFGVDPNLDPELALALRVSMEEERARQSAATAAATEDAGAAGAALHSVLQPLAHTVCLELAVGPGAGHRLSVSTCALLQQRWLLFQKLPKACIDPSPYICVLGPSSAALLVGHLSCTGCGSRQRRHVCGRRASHMLAAPSLFAQNAKEARSNVAAYVPVWLLLNRPRQAQGACSSCMSQL